MVDLQDRNQQLESDDRQYIWPPFTQMYEHVKDDPVIIESGSGCILKDIHGREYIDGISSLWTNVHGHRKEGLDRSVNAQLGKIAHSTMLGLSNVPAIQLAKRLVAITPPGLTRVFYSDSGSTAVEIGLKIAYQYQQQAPGGSPKKKKFISFVNAYHGDTIGSVSVGGMELFHEIYNPLLFKTLKAASPHCYRCPFQKTHPSCGLECLNRLEDLMKRNRDEIAGLVMEALVQGAAGILVHPSGFLKEVRGLCTKYDIIMIVDEVAVGFGKTGTMFACEQEDVVPDILCLAKGISAGYLPLAATLTTEKIYEGFLGRHEEFKTFFHGHTYTGNPLACAAALASLDIFEQERVLEGLRDKIAHFTQRLEPFKALEHVGDVRQCGVMVGIELVAQKDTKRPYPVAKRMAHQVILEARKNGLIIRPLGDVVILMPPLCISIEELDRLCDITYKAIKTVTE